ncbi:MAG: glycosyltransferase [Candidatus Coatesbacteria bacterium]|nr:glycosyltransferase [Candidatus Coatesbacteria bacterium]
MKIAFFGVLSPIRSGVADYCQNLLPDLKELVDIDVFIDDYDPDEKGVASQFPVFNYLRFESRRKKEKYDAIVYQMGNDLHHRFMYHYVFNFPGIVVLHDFNLHPSRASMLQASGDQATYARELEECLGPKGREVARLVATSAQFSALLDTFPMNEKVLSRSLAVIVHNPYVKRMVEKSFPDTPAHLVNMGIPLRKNVLKKAQARRKLNLPLEKFTSLYPGFVGPHRKPDVALDAFAKFTEKHPNALLVFTGEPDPRVDLASEVKRRGLEEFVRLENYVSDEAFDGYIMASDVVLNLRTNKIRETSATMLTAMSLGKPVIATRLIHNCHLPAGTCLFIEHSPTEAEAVAGRLEEIWSNPSEGEQIGNAAQAYIMDNHSIKQAAQGYKTAIDAVLASTTENTKNTKQARTLRERLSWLDEEKQRIVSDLSSGDAEGQALADELEQAIAELGLG